MSSDDRLTAAIDRLAAELAQYRRPRVWTLERAGLLAVGAVAVVALAAFLGALALLQGH